MKGPCVQAVRSVSGLFFGLDSKGSFYVFTAAFWKGWSGSRDRSWEVMTAATGDQAGSGGEGEKMADCRNIGV